MRLSLNRPTIIWAAGAICLVTLMSACNMPELRETTQSGVSPIQTAAAQTVQAQITGAYQAQVTLAALTPVIPASPTTALLTLAPTLTAPPPPTPFSPTHTRFIPTSTPIPCDRAKFVEDVTIPDNTGFAPGSVFVKTWRLQNVGSCTWTSDYALVSDGENVLNAPALVPLTTGAIPPGGMIDISVTLTAPSVAGTYRGNFKLTNTSGQKFALGDGAKPFWAQIKVTVPGGITFDFIARAAQAEWKSGTGNNLDTLLTFGGTDDDLNGVAKIMSNVLLETGAESGKVLLTYPKRANNGLISGTFPPYLVQIGDILKARLGFIANPDASCGDGEVKFQIFYKEGSNILLLGEWNKACDGKMLPVNIDLSSLKGKTIQVILVVKASGSFVDDWAIWNSARIER